jgi:hypothetical protein
MAARHDCFVGRTYARYVQGDSSYSASRRPAAFKAVAQSRRENETRSRANSPSNRLPNTADDECHEKETRTIARDRGQTTVDAPGR